ncbi:hypothetical protein H920_11754 [Fukomys damarensis]|uniref:Uncharacterized protein n=1 Tax=Fukomys damarensis TaxID=885580 RepID=A0A091D423_FUKDA|nr:hypothetical protein H920_11754 [Fukomys damarensis]
MVAQELVLWELDVKREGLLGEREELVQSDSRDLHLKTQESRGLEIIRETLGKDYVLTLLLVAHEFVQKQVCIPENKSIIVASDWFSLESASAASFRRLFAETLSDNKQSDPGPWLRMWTLWRTEKGKVGVLSQCQRTVDLLGPYPATF